jgi:D-galacturonate reductase
VTTPPPSSDLTPHSSFEAFLEACLRVNQGLATVESFDHQLATIGTTYRTTAILEAGRRSLDEGGRPVTISYGDEAHPCTPTGFL